MNQRPRRGASPGALPYLALLAVILIAVAAPRFGAGAAGAPAGQKDGWTTVKLVYHGDSEGKIEPCG